MQLRYQNWHANLPAKLVEWHSPATVKHIRDALRTCVDGRERLLTLGQGMSLSRLVEAGHHVLDPQRFRGATQLEARHLATPMDPNPYFLVGAGTYITELNHVLGLEGWALPTSGAASDQSLAGATSTGTHGAATYGAVHDCIRVMCLITGPDSATLVQRDPGFFTGELTQDLEAALGMSLTVSTAQDDFRAAVVGLGAFGVIHSIVIEAEPLYQLVGCWVDRPMTDATMWDAIRAQNYDGLYEPPKQVAGGVEPFNIAFTFSPYASGYSSVNGIFASFLWKIPPEGKYPDDYPASHPRMASPLERWAASISPYLGNGLVAWIVAQHFHDGEWTPDQPAFPGHVFGPTTIRRNNGRSTEIMVPASQAYDTVRTIIDTIDGHPRKIIGLIGMRMVGKTDCSLLAMNQSDIACVEIPCLNEDPIATSEVFTACWRAVDQLGKPYTLHWGQENALTRPLLDAYYGDHVERWKDARARVVPAPSRVVFRNQLTDQLGLTDDAPLEAPPAIAKASLASAAHRSAELLERAVTPVAQDAPTGSFSGVSRNGDLNEAIRVAVEAAKQGLQSDYIEWTLVHTSGQYGGFISQADLHVTINARSYSTPRKDPLGSPSERRNATAVAEQDDPLERVRAVLARMTGAKLPPTREARLYYVRQATSDVVPSFNPDFVYVLDVGWPRVATLTCPYVMPSEGSGINRRPVGWGDPHFPVFDRGQALSGETLDDVLYPVVAGELLLSPEDGVSDEDFRRAVAPHVLELEAGRTTWVATVRAFHEPEIAAVLSALPEVRYAEMNYLVRSITVPWRVDRVW